MTVKKKTVAYYVCDNCGHEYLPRRMIRYPVCPKCKRAIEYGARGVTATRGDKS